MKKILNNVFQTFVVTESLPDNAAAGVHHSWIEGRNKTKWVRVSPHPSYRSLWETETVRTRTTIVLRISDPSDEQPWLKRMSRNEDSDTTPPPSLDGMSTISAQDSPSQPLSDKEHVYSALVNS
ncbi:hypothetical protein FGIG_08852 [Fasciola gigantica]|uniref:Uncharacterized protein n=1 Tax=Fasciola gigantica TaxID=46835 RepID=A0A504YLA6_FASGI|nr:hypothetical protein FGIG_08852 [Fasciola gigantica]